MAARVTASAKKAVFVPMMSMDSRHMAEATACAQGQPAFFTSFCSSHPTSTTGSMSIITAVMSLPA